MTDPIRAIVADDHPAFRAGVAAILREAGIHVLAEAGDGAAAVAAVAADRPDVALLDLSMPGMSGIDAVREVSNRWPEIPVLVLTMSEDDDSLFAALSAGARGYLLKGSLGPEILQAVHSVLAGALHLPAALSGRVVTAALEGRAARSTALFSDLTARESQVLELVATGLDNRGIADRLGLSTKTVRNLVSTVRTKLAASTRAEAVAIARDAGLGRR